MSFLTMYRRSFQKDRWLALSPVIFLFAGCVSLLGPQWPLAITSFAVSAATLSLIPLWADAETPTTKKVAKVTGFVARGAFLVAAYLEAVAGHIGWAVIFGLAGASGLILFILRWSGIYPTKG